MTLIPFDFGTTDTTIGAIAVETTGTTTEEAAEDTCTLDVGTTLPDGTTSPVAANSIFRFEPRDGASGGPANHANQEIMCIMSVIINGTHVKQLA